MSNIVDEQYQYIINEFPNVILVNNKIFHIKIPLINNVSLEINYRNYPKAPRASLIKPNGEVFPKFDMQISSLRAWKKKNPPFIVDVIKDVMRFIERMQSGEIVVKAELIEGVLALCRNQHPREILGMLRVENGIVSEFILPPGALTNENSGVFSPSRIPVDPSIEGTIHSHPSGNCNPSQADLDGVFKKKIFHFIAGYPYNNWNCLKCWDSRGNQLTYRLIE